ncbi:hypothetical protein [Shewanella gelidii]|uniref:Uncharacterized protein n=1 Tax=Shewanella gelidii TaxID=1642821 RepID=A0A917NBA2_9GAMM|nr:hypothetical protein [Shewanella gelidii]MCL1097603.1 hypothetical protein [Shewanella gelidii]GGI80276.1 hypothetical protein GCM10009332_17030 [Shewanella gelidii]
MKKLIFVLLLGLGYYYYDTQLVLGHDKVYHVANNPMTTYDYIELWQQQAVDLCKEKAGDYHIEAANCSVYISQKFPACHIELPVDLPPMIDSLALGEQVIGDYYRCISPQPHCQGQEITSDAAYERYCVARNSVRL